MASHNWHMLSTHNGDVLLNTLTSQAWDAHHWTHEDWKEFVKHHEGDKWGQTEGMQEIDRKGVPIVCPRCHDVMDPRFPALSRLTRGETDTRIYVCSDCGTEEAVLQWHNNGVPVDWRNQ